MGFVVLCLIACIGFYDSLVVKNLPLWAVFLTVPVAAFLLTQSHRQQDKTLRLFRLCEYYDTGIARLTRNWEVLDEGKDFLDPDHFYATDLDLFGHGSLFQLMCSARTQAGRETLAGWMKAPAIRGEVLARRDAISELRARQDLREALAMAGAVQVSNCRPGTFSTWVGESIAPFPFWAQGAAFAFTGSLLGILFLYWFGRGIDGLTLARSDLVALFSLQGIFAGVFLSRVRSISGGGDVDFSRTTNRQRDIFKS